MTKSALFSVRKNEPCPQCGAELVIRSGKHGPFLGCSHYPDCDYIRPLKSQADGHIVKVLEGQECPSCGAVMDKAIWSSVVPVSVKPFTPAIAILIASSLSILNRWRANALNAITRC
jgi:ribosomal protein S27AE